MTDKDYRDFAAQIAGLWEVFGHGEMSEVLVEIYYQALQDLSIEELRQASGRVIATRKVNSMPKPAEIREAVFGSQEEKALKAWEDVEQAVRQRGAEDSIQFDDPAIHGVIELMGGWPALASSPSFEDWKWKRIEFQKIYPTLARRKEHPEYLPGEHENSGNAWNLKIYRVGSGNGKRKQLTDGRQ